MNVHKGLDMEVRRKFDRRRLELNYEKIIEIAFTTKNKPQEVKQELQLAQVEEKK